MNIKQRIQQTFLELINISEIYPNEDKVIDYCLQRLNGLDVQLDAFRNIVIKIPGSGDPVLLSTHVDVPEPNPNVRYTIKGDIIAADGTNILGADPKGGLAILLEWLIDVSTQSPASHVPIEVLLTRGEEVGLHGARNADYNLLSAKLGLVFDEDGPVTQVVKQAPAYVRVDATFIGKVVHPREPEKGINALQMAATAMNRVPCGHPVDGVTWNIGQFESGTARNSVPGRATLRGELRSFDEALVQAQVKRIVAEFTAIAQEFRGNIEIETSLDFGAYHLPEQHPLFDRLNTVFAAMNLTPNYFATFGGTDANVFNAHGIMSVAMGSGYYNAHEYTEYVNLAEMEDIYHFLFEFVKEE